MNDSKSVVEKLFEEEGMPSDFAKEMRRQLRGDQPDRDAITGEPDDDSPVAIAVRNAEIDADRGKPTTIVFNPEALKTIAYFLYKPHHDTAVKKMHDVLVTAFQD